MSSNYGIRTATFLDRRLKHGSTVAKYLDAHGVNTGTQTLFAFLTLTLTRKA